MSLYLEGIRDGDYVTAINTYAGERYTQHSTPVRDGRDGFIEFFADFIDRNPTRDIEILRGFEDGQFVFLHAAQNLDGGRYRYVTADIFDTDDNAKLIEHWDIIEELEGTNGSGRSQVDGPTEISDLEFTASNKRVVTDFLEEVLIDGALERLPEFMASDYAEHNSGGADGIPSLRAYVAEHVVRYVDVHRVVGSGNFVAALSESESGGSRRAVIDLFRLESGMIVEHWDVVEEIAPEETWVNSGKF